MTQAFLLLLTLTILGLVAGDAVLRRLNVAGLSGVGVVLFALAIGLGVQASGIALLGVCGLFRPFAAAAGITAVTLLALSLRSQRRAVADVTARWLRGLKSWRPDVMTAGLSLAIFSLAGLTLTGALAPPTSNEWDTLAYHFAVPKVWLHDGRMHMLPYDNHAGFPMLAEMLYSFGLERGSVSAAKLVHWMYGMLCALTCYWAGRHWVSRKAGLLAAVLFLAVPVVAWEATTAYIDLAATFYVTLSVFAFARWIESAPPSPNTGGAAPATPTSPNRPSERGGTGAEVSQPPSHPLAASSGWLWLAGICGGLACGVKMTMVATSGILVLWAVGLALTRKASWKQAGLLAVLMLFIGGPWYIRTWVWTGNPFYPFAYSIFGGHWWGAAQAAQYAAEQGRFGIGKTLYGLWVSPWSTAFHAQYYANPPATFKGALEASGRANVFAAVFGTLGIGLIGLLPLWLLGSRKDTAGRAVMWFAVYGGAFVCVWFALTHQTRYLIPVLPLFLVTAVAGVRYYWNTGRGWRLGLSAFTVLTVVWGMLPLWTLVQPCFGVAWGGQSQDEYLSASEPVYTISQDVNRELPANARILMLNEVRGFYLDRPYVWGDWSQSTVVPWDRVTSPDELNAELKVQGITHVLINWGPQTAPSEKWPGIARSAVRYARWTPVLERGKFVVYAVGPS